MLARLPRIIIALALASSIGLHWAALQAVAWAGMVISYSHDAPVTEAVVKTFDGNHPCDLCKQIAKGKRSEKKMDFKVEFGKVKFPYAPVTFVFAGPPLYWELAALDQNADPMAHPPLLPPPRDLTV